MNCVGGMPEGRLNTRCVGSEKYITIEVFNPKQSQSEQRVETLDGMPFWVLVQG